ncbi:hypothetical protein JW698_00930 [Candidatus Wolfebacteria bacterium]|nr:hypothetical protein [Candidatus Wolfebacteria bacterium]
MKKEKIAAMILIIFAGIAGSYFIIKNSMPQVNEFGNKLISEENKLSIKNPIQWVEEGISNIMNFMNETEQIAQAEENLTQSFSQILSEQIKLKNQNGLTQKDGEVAISAPNEEMLSQELLEELMSNNLSDENTELYHPMINENKFKISQNVSAENQVQYLKNLENISQKKLEGFNKTDVEILNTIAETGNSSSARELANLYEEMANDYYTVTIPVNWVDFHKALLSHFYSASFAWRAIANFEEDPLKAYLATQALSALEESSFGIQVLMSNGILENNLNF